MELEDYIVLEKGVPVRLVFDAYGWYEKEIVDPDLKVVRVVEQLKFHVIWKNGEQADTIYSAIAGGIKNELRPYLDRDRYKDYEFTIMKGTETWAGPKVLEVKKLKR